MYESCIYRGSLVPPSHLVGKQAFGLDKGKVHQPESQQPCVPSKLSCCCLHLMVNSVIHKETMQGSLRVHVPANSVPKEEGDPSSNKNPSSPASACLTGYVHFLSENSSILHFCRFYFCGPDRSIQTLQAFSQSLGY